jgi:hypothetical protein
MEKFEDTGMIGPTVGKPPYGLLPYPPILIIDDTVADYFQRLALICPPWSNRLQSLLPHIPSSSFAAISHTSERASARSG